MKIVSARFAGSSTRTDRKPSPALPEFAFIGRSNVGKSSLINMLAGNHKLAMTSSTPGKTKLVNHFLINDRWYLVDLPGYGYAKLSQKGRDELRTIVRDYVFNSAEMQILFVLIDARHDIGAADWDFLCDLGENGIPFAIIFTKCDKLGPVALENQIARDRERLLESWEELPPCFLSSAETGKGKEEILSFIESILSAT
ncbi:MAG: YihA family ribosome biogenesis GTP-binding protein [Bacteroidales bacterium]|nr:YihA family ribosome biogenesis GTP-binding protein [Bacteroidales bacterium]